MTAADHANTVREALAVLAKCMADPRDEVKAANAALDALQTQAETAGGYWGSEYLKLEAERDHARDALRQIAGTSMAHGAVVRMRQIARAALGDKPTSELPRPYGRSVTDYPA